jgi:hypothetical protein
VDQHGYVQSLRSSVAASAAPHGYTLTLWTTGAVTIHVENTFPSTLDALLLLIGAAAGFGLVGALAFGGIRAALAPGTPTGVAVWGGIHLPSVGAGILLCSLLAHLVSGHGIWPLVGFTATTTYLLVLGGQFWLATTRPQRHV